MREQIARILMEARPNGGCIVRDWEAEGRDNPHVATALAQADALLPIIEKAVQAGLDAAAEIVLEGEEDALHYIRILDPKAIAEGVK